jgi:hypothetical protein
MAKAYGNGKMAWAAALQELAAPKEALRRSAL